MAKSDIKKIIDDAKTLIEGDRDSFANSIKDDLQSFKKKALDGVS